MSTPIHEKFENIRKETGLSRDAFAEKTGVSVNTLKAILSRGSSPRFEVVEKIALAYPQYALYLTAGSIVDSSKQSEPDIDASDQTVSWRIIQQLTTTKLNQCAVKSEWFDKFVFLQGEEISDLMGLIVIKGLQPNDVSCIKIGYGELSFGSPGGINSLDRVRDWLRKERPDLIKTTEFFTTETEVLDNLYKSLEVQVDDLKEEDSVELSGLLTHAALCSWREDEKIDMGQYF